MIARSLHVAENKEGPPGIEPGTSGGKATDSLRTHLEQEISQLVQWAVFEPNGEPLWSQLRRQVGDYLHSYFSRGELKGAKPEQAYFVRCDATTNTQADIDAGRLTIVFGFAPLVPEEFIVDRIWLQAGTPS